MSSFLGFEPTKRPDYFFISYNTEDADRIAPLTAELSRDGVPLWYDYGIPYGDKWEPRIAEKIVGAQAVILFFTKGILAKEDSYVKTEYQIAKSRQKKIYIILLDKIADSDVPVPMLVWWYKIQDQQCIPAYDLQPGKLLPEIRRALGIESRKKTPPAATMQRPKIMDWAEYEKSHTKPVQLADNAAKASPAQAKTGQPPAATMQWSDLVEMLEGKKDQTEPAQFADKVVKASPAPGKTGQLSAQNNAPEADFTKHAKIENGVLVKYTGSEADVCIPRGVISIGKWAFDNCTSLTSVTIPDSVTSICDCAFRGCSALTSVTIPGSVTSIGYSAFSGCRSLISVTISEGVATVSPGAFSGCSSLTSVTIPGSVRHMPQNPFDGCGNLKKIAVSAENPHFYAESGHLIDKRTKTLIIGSAAAPIPTNGSVTRIGASAFAHCAELTSVTIPNGVTHIGDGAFDNCDALTTVTIPGSVTTIGHRAFHDCDGLTSVTIPNGVTGIGDYAFCGCESLTSVMIPGSVTSIGMWAFSGCTALTSVTIPASVTSIGHHAFEKHDKFTIFTPHNSFAWKWAEKNHIPVEKLRKPGMHTLLPFMGK